MTISDEAGSVEITDPKLPAIATFTLGDALAKTGIPLNDMMAIRHAYVKIHKDGDPGIHADSTDDEILAYTSTQSLTGFAKKPPRYWVVLLPGQGNRARLWRIVENLGEAPPSESRRTFGLRDLDLLPDLMGRCVVQWGSPRAWWVHGTTVANYPVLDIADVEPEPFPGFDHLVIDHERLQAVVREPLYAAWRTALSSVIGIYLITDTSDGRHYVGKADGHETLLQRWTSYATNGHGGNVGLKLRDATKFRYSVLRVLDPSSAEADINAVEKHYKDALDSRSHGLNEN
ncbi:GIY-YIG nuclease family protein [Nocardioides sp. YIM 152588]|uniref:GIY-YIG nuclease family protein n=1 Tax=Nocardioides sp. YIM 152588 TaxID=3158259 RepID=UPI0032E3BE94